jgi:uncharacterized membrane protein
MENTNGTFNYTYSANQQEEVKSIRQKYAPREENKVEQLRALDRSVTTRGQIVSLTVGIISSLLLGTGMACIMEWDLFIAGIAVGLVGMVGMLLAYPIYNMITRKRREKLAPQIIKLSDELMQ